MIFIFIVIVLAAAAGFAFVAYRQGRFNARNWLRRASTILGLLSVAQGGAIIGYQQSPAEWQAMLPANIGGYLLIGMMLTGALTPVATSIHQKWLKA